MYSVLISVYYKDEPSALSLALNSLVTQTLEPNEIVLVKDGPLSNDLESVIFSYTNLYSYIKVFELKENSGLGKALNLGLQKCQNELIARMDADDISYSRRMEIQWKFMENNPDVAVVGSALEEFDTAPGDLSRYRILPTKSDALKIFALSRSPLNHPTVMFRKSVVLDVGGYEDCLYFEDYYLWLKLISNNYKIANLKEPLLYFRSGNDMIGRRHGWRYLQFERNFYRRCRQARLLSPMRSHSMFFLRAVFRLLPKSVLSFIYRLFLR